MEQLSIWHAAILGLVEGLTEYIPVSSTGHLILTAALLGLDEPPERKHAIDAFNIVIQGGAILAVLGLYFPRIMQMIRGFLGRDRIGFRLAINLVVAFLPAAILGVLLDELIESHLFHPGPVIAALIIGGIVMLLIGPWQRRFFHGREDVEPDDAHSFVDLEHLTWKRALIIGLLQCLAMWPGTSRSMVTIVGGMLVGLRPKHAAEFSFLLGLPTLGGACIYKGAKNLMGEGPDMIETLGLLPLIVGFLVATVAAALAIKWLVAYLTKHGLALFGWYRIALGVVMILLVVRGVIHFAPAHEQVNKSTGQQINRSTSQSVNHLDDGLNLTFDLLTFRPFLRRPFRGLDGVAHEHGDGHRSDAARHG